MFRRRLLEEVGGFAPGGYDGSSYEHWHLWLTLAESHELGTHAGEGRVTYQRRLHGRRKLQSGRCPHRELYDKLRDAHPEVFNSLHEHRRAPDLSLSRKLLYPAMHGKHRRWFEPPVTSMLDMLGVWKVPR